MKIYNSLTPSQIAALEAHSCRCDDWSGVTVSPDFDPKYVRNVNFSGTVRLGFFKRSFTLPGGIRKHSGVFHATLHNVTVGDDCMIEHVGNYIANYDIGDNCFIENVTELITDGRSSFGNGTEVRVLNEMGGREVYIHDNLSAHEAYIMALYRHRPAMTAALKAMVDDYVREVTSDRGTIGCDVEIVDAMHIVNVRVGDCARIKGVSRLSNGTIISKRESPVHIGLNVIADDFVICSGSRVSDGTMLTRCFVGQACELGHGYSASDSLFFSNCQEENGEACALFAGPYTVTHHKSTLLIAGMFSFMNAGSGSNQSNHMYKLGPVHQGILERGAKTSSDSYILWPAKIGAFSLVMGRHVGNLDTTDLPFSYLIEKQGVTYIAPGVNLKSVGTIRDVRKWPERDRRKDPVRLDYINFNHLSPFTVQKMFSGLELLESLRNACGSHADSYCYKKGLIRNAALFKGMEYYRTAIIKFLGNSIISCLEKYAAAKLGNGLEDGLAAKLFSSDEALREAFARTSPTGCGHWTDLSGLIAPASEVDRLCDDIQMGNLHALSEISERFRLMYDSYYSWEWTWAREKASAFFSFDFDAPDRSRLKTIIEEWKEAVSGLDDLIYDDARKEFTLSSMTGFGADGDKTRRNEDFINVRGGGFDENPFVKEVLDHKKRKSALGDRVLAALG